MALPQTFTGAVDTELNALDAKWVKNTNYTGFLELDGAGRYRAADVNSSCYKYNESPPSADYGVKQDVYFPNTISPAMAVCCRMHTSDNTMYFWRWNSGLQLYKILSGTVTQIGSTIAQTVNAGETHNFEIRCIGNTIKGFFDGVEKISVTDTSITAAGFGGIRSSAGTTLGDNFSIPELESGSVTHAATGALTADAATISGTAVYNAAHGSTGALAGGEATIAGTSARSGSFITHAATGDLVAGAATIASNASSFTVHASTGALTATAATIAGTAARSAGTASFSTPPMRNNTGTLLASLSGWTVNVFNASTGALVVQKTGLSTDASGIITVTDALLVAGTTYSYEPVHATYGRRLPTAAAA